jgi:hypothetical protein
MASPLKILRLLDARQLAALESFCRGRYRTIDEVRARLRAQDVRVGRGAVHLWLKRFNQSQSPRTSGVKRLKSIPLPPTDEAVRNRIAEILPALRTRQALATVLYAAAGELLAAIGPAAGSILNPRPRRQTGANETRRRIRVLTARARPAHSASDATICPLCGGSYVGMGRHLQRRHLAGIRKMPAESFA